ncbi:unnamed protein product [Dovyalis caffra]|uniref:Uncharacterized protein n=1 Tax=Dovyalis caffra TaxID=77055 RepID=A0AAV1RRQ5_9ROSI|nr:unnamed protein product [Dovyalis caffra]
MKHSSRQSLERSGQIMNTPFKVARLFIKKDITRPGPASHRKPGRYPDGSLSMSCIRAAQGSSVWSGFWND